MTKLQYQASSVTEFLEHANGLRKVFQFPKDDPWAPWFRGHTVANWGLRPRLYREYGNFRTIKRDLIEDEIREEFIVRAPIFCENLPDGEELRTEWEWYFMMQHFGTPTRLLDWTDGALIALYFAVKDNAGFFDAAVWVLDPYALNKRRQAIQKGWVIPPSAPRLDERVRRRVNRWLPMRYDGMKGLPEATIAVYPTHTERRISTQRSCFTIHGKDCGALDDLWNAGSRCLAKIKIPAWSVQQIKRELGGAGIDEATIFPDLSGLSRTIAARWKPDGNPHPHQKVYTRVRPSKIHGVGVFALVKIKKGTPLFEGESPEMPWFEKKSLPREPHAIRMLYNDFAAIDPEDRYGCPRSFNCLTPAWYLNEPKPGDRPNVNCDPETFEFTAAESIEPGVELTVSYRTYSSVPPSKSKKT